MCAYSICIPVKFNCKSIKQSQIKVGGSKLGLGQNLHIHFTAAYSVYLK